MGTICAQAYRGVYALMEISQIKPGYTLKEWPGAEPSRPSVRGTAATAKNKRAADRMGRALGKEDYHFGV